MVGVARIELATPAMSMRCETPNSKLSFNGLAAMVGALAQYLPKSPIGCSSFDSDSHWRGRASTRFVVVWVLRGRPCTRSDSFVLSWTFDPSPAGLSSLCGRSQPAPSASRRSASRSGVAGWRWATRRSMPPRGPGWRIEPGDGSKQKARPRLRISSAPPWRCAARTLSPRSPRTRGDLHGRTAAAAEGGSHTAQATFACTVPQAFRRAR